MEQKIGCYICEGCGIGANLDLGRLEKIAGQYQAAACRRHPCLCNDAGVDLIKNDCAQSGVNTIVIAACSPREMVPRFDFAGSLVERVNLREQVVWTHDPEKMGEADAKENVNMLAEDYLRLGFVKAQKSQLPEPYIIEPFRRVLVIGGGVSGLSAALNVAKAGVEAVIVEKQPELGGWARRLHRAFPRRAPFLRLIEPEAAALAAEVAANGKIAVHTNCEVAKISGAPGEFKVELTNGAALDIGTVILAAGWKPFDTAKFHDKYGYGTNPNVITSIQFEEMIQKNGKIARPSDGGEVSRIAFVTAVDTKEGNQTPYLGKVADLVALKQIHYLKEQNPQAVPYLFHDHVQASGLYEDFYRDVQKEGLVLARGHVTSIGAGVEKPVLIEGEDVLLGQPVAMEVDLVVLSVGMVPVTLDEKVLHLAYRQGPELPELSNGYPNSHFICFPYETRRTGIYACGAVREPMELPRVADDAAGAALKAIQAIELISRGMANHPRVGDLSYPDFALQRCTQCKRCTEECPFGSLDEDEKGTPKPNPTRCRRCGICMGACPERIIGFANYTVDMIGSMIKAVQVPDEFEEKPRILAFVCENDAYPAMDMAAANRLQYSSYLRVIPLRCLGSINLVWIADALAKGFDGILLLGCKHGQDYQCHFIKGSELASTRMEKVSETLTRLMLESNRINFKEINITDYKEIPSIINSFVEKLAPLGPNPYKQ